MAKSIYGQHKQKITLSLTPYCIAQLYIYAMRIRKDSISDMFEQLVRGKAKTPPNIQATDEEILNFMIRYKPREIENIPQDRIAPHFREIYFKDHSQQYSSFDFL